MLFADIIRQCVKIDVPVRYGGEEFLIFNQDMTLLLQKRRGQDQRQLEKQRIHFGQQKERQRVTVSCGAYSILHSVNIKEVIEKADQALYHAKNRQNIVVTFDEIGLERKDIEKDQTWL